MFKDAQQGVWDWVQEQILIRMLRRWGRRYKSDDEENLPVICRTIQLLYFKFCHIILTLSFFHCTLVLLILADYLNSLSLLSRSPPLPALSLVSWGRLGKFDLLGALIVFLSPLLFASKIIFSAGVTRWYGLLSFWDQQLLWQGWFKLHLTNISRSFFWSSFLTCLSISLSYFTSKISFVAYLCHRNLEASEENQSKWDKLFSREFNSLSTICFCAETFLIQIEVYLTLYTL